MRSARIMLVGSALSAALAGGCSTHTLRGGSPTHGHQHAVRVGCACDGCSGHRDHHDRCRNRCHDHGHDRCWHRHAEPPTPGVRWDAVLPPPEVARFERNYGRDWQPETWRNDERMSERYDGPSDAVSASWPEPWRPDLDSDRTGRTSTDPERFIYSSRRAYTPRYHTQYRRWR